MTEVVRRSAVVLANGRRPTRETLRSYVQRSDLFLAADGALDFALAAGLTPDYVVGDFDSVSGEALRAIDPATLIRIEDQQLCDLEKALNLAVDLQVEQVIVLGALGKRMDHSLTSLSVGLRLAHRVSIRLIDGGTELIPVVSEALLQGSPGDTVSLIVWEPVRGVTLSGVRWPLHDEDLAPGSRCVSNVLIESSAAVSVREGRLIACRIRRPRSGRSA